MEKGGNLTKMMSYGWKVDRKIDEVEKCRERFIW